MIELIIKFYEDVPDEVIDLILDNYDANRVHTITAIGWHKLEVENADSERILAELRADLAVASVFKNGEVKSATLDFFTNDPWQNRNWQHSAVRLPQAWNKVRGYAWQKVAVFDTGANVNHEDFKDDSGTSRIIPELNTYGDVDSTYIVDGFGHGTKCISVGCATGNNAKGVAGANWFCKVGAYKISKNLSTNPGGDFSSPYAIVAAITDAADKGYRFGNLSWDLGDARDSLAPVEFYQEAVDYAFDRNLLIFLAAGNANKNAMALVQNEIQRCVIVGALMKGYQKTPYSNYGPWVTVVAPVGDTLTFASTVRPSLESSQTFTVASNSLVNGYNEDSFGGTSAATPLSWGVTTLGHALASGLTNYQFMALVRYATRKLDGRWHDQNGAASGMVDAVKMTDTAELALPGAAPRPTVIMAAPKHNSSVYLGVNDTVLFEALVFDENPVQSVSLYVDGSETPFGTVTQEPFIIPWTPSGTGTHAFQLKATSSSGTGLSETNTVVVLPATTGVAPFVAFTSHRQGDTVGRNFHLEAVASCHGIMPAEPVDTRVGSYPVPYLDKLDVVVKQGATTIATIPQFRVGGSFADIVIPNNILGTITLQATAVTSDGMTATTSMDVTVAAVGTTGSFTAPAVTLRPVVAAPSLTGVQRGSFSMPSVSLSPTVAAPSLTGVSATVSPGNFDLPSVTLRPIVAAPQLSGMTGGASIRAPSGQLLNLRRIDGTPLTIYTGLQP